jgi:hypothetical protein
VPFDCLESIFLRIDQKGTANSGQKEAKKLIAQITATCVHKLAKQLFALARGSHVLLRGFAYVLQFSPIL